MRPSERAIEYPYVIPRRILLWLALYAIAMANVEAVLVVYLRDIYYPDDPVTIFPLVFL